MRKHLFFLFLISTFWLSSCIGTDYINDPLPQGMARVEIKNYVTALEINQQSTFTAQYYDANGDVDPAALITWQSSDATTANVDANGVVRALQIGQAEIVAMANGIASDPVLISVVADPNAVASVVVQPSSANLIVGETRQFSAQAYNLNGDALSGQTFTWQSSDSDVLSIDASGLATAIASGTAGVRASTGGINSPLANVSVSSQSRSGMFTRNPATSYTVSGTATLSMQSGSLLLEFGSDFVCSSGPGLNVFLSNTSGVSGSSLDLGALKSTSGSQSYAVPSGVQITDYEWVVVHCVPFNATFGYAQLQ